MVLKTIMLKKIQGIDRFSKNIIIVFFGSSVSGFLNLVYQLLIAHLLNPADFSAFNSLLSIFMIISAPLVTLTAAIAKYTAEFNAHNQIGKIQALLAGFLKKTIIFSIITFIGFSFFSFYLFDKLKIDSLYSGYILAGLLALSWILPVLTGSIQGLELFKKQAWISIIGGLVKIALTFAFILMGFNIAGAFGALFLSSLLGLGLMICPLKNYFVLKTPHNQDSGQPGAKQQLEQVNFKEILMFMLPVALSSFCFANLTNMDMILIKYFFSPLDSGVYSLAQMTGKIFLFFPAAIGMALFPRTSALNAKKAETIPTLKKSLFCAAALCVIASLTYNLFPGFVLKILTGKAFAGAIFLGRLFSISMSFFALIYILITYFLSMKDLRFIKYLVIAAILQFFAIWLFHKTFVQVQLSLCLNAILIFSLFLALLFQKKEK